MKRIFIEQNKEVELNNIENWSLITNPFHSGDQFFGALVAITSQNESSRQEELIIQIQTFAQNLSALLLNLMLLVETRQRTKELEVLYGRFVDDIWRDDNVQLSAAFVNGQFQLNQLQHAPENPKAVALSIGEHTIGELDLAVWGQQDVVGF